MLLLVVAYDVAVWVFRIACLMEFSFLVHYCSESVGSISLPVLLMTLQLAVLLLITLAAVLACRRAMKPSITPTATSITTTTPSTISLASNISTTTIIPPSPSSIPVP
ncbi:unnamed protein product [Wuchereria bancrofti]|uniref:Uncharacterized protein n=1 Tax=Wuchereria bancrofti TaxID=6293 RepID=A0A3P7EDH7_WUCBA|nr:unnamed protein product [Wuchereria bancrofti]